MLTSPETAGLDLVLNLLEPRGPLSEPNDTLDPSNWDEFRSQAHKMLDDMLDYTQHIRHGPVWRQSPAAVRDGFREPVPQEPTGLASVHQRFLHEILPYTAGNVHPGFMGWVHGGGTPVGMLAEMLAGGLNANLAGRNQVPVDVERQVVQWVRTIFGFPETASGLFVTGTSMANFIALLVARRQALGPQVRKQGITGSQLVAYASKGAHRSMGQALDFAGIGSDHLRLVPVNARHEMDLEALTALIRQDREAGRTPFFVTGAAGTVDVGAVDDLAGVSQIARNEGLWFHVDGAYGALAMLAPDLAPRLKGIELADSIAFDFHKWGQVPYDAGFVLVRDGALHERTFASPACYLSRESRGLAAGSPWPCDFGPDQSRGFRALKAWFTIQVYGAKQLGEVISKTCHLAQYLRQRIENEPRLELLAPVSLNIVCFGYRCANPGEMNRDIVADLQESGIAAPSTTTIDGCLAIRTAIVNHRTSEREIDALIEGALAFGEKRELAQQGVIGLGTLAKIVFRSGDLSPVRGQLADRIARDRNDANALMDLSTITQLAGMRGEGLALQARALKLQQIFHLEPPISPAQIRLLAISCPGDLAENNALEFLVDGSDISLDTLYVAPGLPLPSHIPDHDVAMVTICESDRNRPLLHYVERLIKNWPRPVLCAPRQIAALSRDSASALLQDMPGVVSPLTRRMGGVELEAVRTGFPLIARPVDSHKGSGLERLNSPVALSRYLAERTESDFYVAPFVDFSSSDGQFRKYRIMFIDGKPYVCHLAISSHWIVHYLSSGMVGDEVKRAEEAGCFASFDECFARRHRIAFDGLCERVKLAYFGIDCAETQDGRLLVFEADSGMTIHAMDPVDVFPYKEPHMRRVFRAFRQMLVAHAARDRD